MLQISNYVQIDNKMDQILNLHLKKLRKNVLKVFAAKKYKKKYCIYFEYILVLIKTPQHLNE